MAIQFLRYGAVGLVNTLIGGACIMLAFALTHHLLLSNLFGYIIGFSISFALNRVWTFRNIITNRSINGSFWRFAVVSLVAYGINLATILFVSNILGMSGYLVQFCGLAVYVAVGFLGSRYIAFTVTLLPAQQK